MKKHLLILAMATLLAGCNQTVEQHESDQLPKPDANTVKMALADALWNRHSTWQHTDNDISNQELGYVLWAATGINRPDEGGLTVPSAGNAQDIQVYVCRANGTYLYNIAEHRLDKISDKDIRDALSADDPQLRMGPTALLLVSDLKKFNGDLQFGRAMAPLDAGHVSENIVLMCTALGLNVVPRMKMDYDAVKQQLGLGDLQVPLLNIPISKP